MTPEDLKPDLAGQQPGGSGAEDAELVEQAAEKVYAAMVWAALTRGAPDPNWTPRGSSDAQHEARRAARYVLALAWNRRSPTWEEIEGAPRDGSIIDVWVAHEGQSSLGYRVPDAFWLTEESGWFVEDGEGVRSATSLGRIATHWKPNQQYIGPSSSIEAPVPSLNETLSTGGESE